jgi:hypothetical protein
MSRFVVPGPILAISILLTGCAATGSPQLASCLADHDVMAQFHAHPSRGKTLVGGLAADGKTVSCYWSDEHAAFVYFSTAWTACQRDGNIECKYLANGERIVFAGHEESFAKPTYAASAPGTTGGSGGGEVIWYLLGKFAEGLAMGYMQAQTQRTVYAAPSYEFSAPSYSATPRATTFKCSPQALSLTLSGAPEYVCRY